jgi:fatty-acyl-CoA synthase
VNINPAYKLNELEYSLNKVKCKGIILSENYKTQNFIGLINTLCPELDTSKPGTLESKRVPSLKNVIVISEKDYKYIDID